MTKDYYEGESLFLEFPSEDNSKYIIWDYHKPVVKNAEATPKGIGAGHNCCCCCRCH